MKYLLFSLALCVVVAGHPAFAASGASAHPGGQSSAPADAALLKDRAALDEVQRDAFRYIWEDADPVSGMVYETSIHWGGPRPVAVGGTGFGISALVVAVERGWITREQAVDRLLTITRFLRDKSPRNQMHGAFPHWIDSETGQSVNFGGIDAGADLVETSFLMQGLLTARAYFDKDGDEAALRSLITELWEGVDWNWFTNGEDSGIYWHWSPTHGFSMGLKILGYNECLITYLLAIASPTHPISRNAYDYWTSGHGYQPKESFGYRIEAALANPGPLFLTHYSFIGLDPRRMADSFVPGGYFARNVRHTLSNRGYSLYEAPAENRYAENYWGLTASLIKGGYAANEPASDSSTVAPTAALSSMPYTPHYAMQVLHNIRDNYRTQMWGKNGPYDAFSLRENWFGDTKYIAIDQLPIVCMIENYRSGMLWDLFMDDKDVQRGLTKAGISEPAFATGFPEAVVTLKKEGTAYVPDAYAARRHPDSGQYVIPFWNGTKSAADVSLVLTDSHGTAKASFAVTAAPGRNALHFNPSADIPTDGAPLTLILRLAQDEFRLPVKLY